MEWESWVPKRRKTVNLRKKGRKKRPLLYGGRKPGRGSTGPFYRGEKGGRQKKKTKNL